MSEYLQAAESAARAGGAVLLDWMDRFQAREKAPKDLVSEADLASQELIQRRLLEQFPDHGFLGEEDGTSVEGADGRFRWIVDPLDGTANYVHRVPQFAVSIALECDGQIVAGVVFDPVADECFTTAAGGGAQLNGAAIAVSDVTALDQALVVASFSPYIRRDSPEIEHFADVLVACQTLRRTGSAALNLAYLAAGRFDGYWATSTKTWDVAAGFLLVREAGGVLTDLGGGPADHNRPIFVASATPALHDELRPLVAGE